MVEPSVSELDPLGSYSYPTCNNYPEFAVQNEQFTLPIKLEQGFNYLETNNVNNQSNTCSKSSSNKAIENTSVNPSNSENNIDIKPVIRKGRVKNEKKNAFISEKIADENFPFYGCAICNISFTQLRELDSHVTMHKERITSYDLRIKNQLKKKKLKKEQKKLKKLKKEEQVEIEIKPEDGYIGNEKVSELSLNNNSSEKETKFNPNGKVSKSQTDSEKQGADDMQKIYKCFACQKQFLLSYYLKLHVRSHTDEKPYTCEQCGQSFITASKLGRHNKRFHLSIQYQCRICYRKFYRFEILTRHFDKKHAEDKLEGEPYDFNAILPYLKELEEQLREKQEAEKTKLKEDPWSKEFVDTKDQEKTAEKAVEKTVGETVVKKEVEIEIEEVKVPMDGVEIKVENENDTANENDNEVTNDNDNEMTQDNDNFHDDVGGDVNGSLKEEDSDSDYFPSNTWTSKIDSPKGDKTPSVQCPICQKSLSTASYMRVHMRTHTGEKPFKCYICDMGFITASKMHRHVLTHPEAVRDENVKHENCETDIKQESNEDGENKDKIRKTVKKLGKKNGEKSKKYKKRPHSCEYCHKRFLHLDTLQIHKKSHEGEVLKYRCHFCLLELQNEENLRAHEATHTGAKPYQCGICGKCYKKRESMIYHRKNHRPDREYICDICTKSFSAACKLRRHLAAHSADKFVLKYECPVCAHMFNTRYHVRAHLASHQREGVIQEENRNEILAMVLQNARKIPKKGESHNLTDVIPTDERSRVCNICGEVFQHFYYLEEHLKSHGSKIAIEDFEREEEKKYICQVCNKGFKLHYYLKLHTYTHTKEKPFICQQCGKGFITRGKLKRHLETHTGLKKYQCHICYKFFTRPSYLRIHVRTIHGTQLVRMDGFGVNSMV